ncbi:MAG TPA: hypothetical protein VJ505_09445 [Holophagaceae bacterium]|nr:hypothetical protein [Holophagaceae bacterium]
MRPFILFATLPLLAAVPSKGKAVTVKITQASVTWGAGVEPKGALPPGRFQAEVTVEGAKATAKLEFRAWRLQVMDLPALERGANLRFVRKGQGHLNAKATEGAKGVWSLSGEWPGAPKAEDRLVVEVWSGARRLGYAVAPLREQLIPTARPQEGQASN